MWCADCNIPLSLNFLEEEKLHGLTAVFYVRCCKCHELKEVLTDSPAPTADGSSRPLYSANLKNAMGCLVTGIGHKQINGWLSCMNVPPVHRTIMKRAEERIGPVVVQVAEESCREAIRKERELTIKNSAPRSSALDAGSDKSVSDTPAPDCVTSKLRPGPYGP